MKYWSPIRVLVANLATWLIWGVILAAFLASDVQAAGQDMPSRALPYVHQIEFDFVGWTLNALGVKIQEASAGEQAY